MRQIRSFCFCWFIVAQFHVASPVPAAVIVVVPVVVSSVRNPVLFVLAVAVFVAVVFPEVLVIVTDVASVSGLLVAVSWAVVILVPIGLFHSNAVLSLSSSFFSLPLACFGSHSFVVLLVPCFLSFDYLLVLFLCFQSLFLDMFVIISLCRISNGFVVVVVVVRFCCTYGVLVCMNFGFRSICCMRRGRKSSSISSGFDIVCFEWYCQTF